MSFELVIQKAIYEKLVASADLIEKQIPVYDDVPQPADSGDLSNFPYVVVGDDSVKAWDTDTENGADAVITIHTWSRYLGKKEIKELQEQIMALQNLPTADELVESLTTQVVRQHGATQLTLLYQEERILKQDARIATLEKLVDRIVNYTGMTEGHLR